MSVTLAQAGLSDVEHAEAQRRVTGVLWALVAVKVGLHLLVNGISPYGLHRDEFLYLAMGEHPAWGYHEAPPLIGGLAWLIGGPGTALFVVRLLPALAGGLIVLLAGSMARRLGGGALAVALTGVCLLIAPVYLRSSNLFQPVVFDQLAWTTAAFCLLLRIEREDRRWWPADGAACGVGLLVKYSMLFWGAGLLAGTLLTRYRRDLLTPWPWLGAGLAVLIALPNVLWQVGHGWPLLAHMNELAETQLVHVSRVDFIAEQVLMMHPFTFPVWSAGLFFFFFRNGARYRPFGWAVLVAVGLIILGRGKAYYAGPVYPLLLAGGAVVAEDVLNRAGRGVRVAALAVLVAGGAVFLPLGVPLMRPEAMARFERALGIESRFEDGRALRIQQDYHDMLGWAEQVRTVASVYHSLPEAEQTHTVLLAGNYGEAGAIDHYGGRYGLPKATSTNSSYYNWGPGPRSGGTAVSIGIDLEDLLPYYRTCALRAVHRHPWAIFYETDLPVYICRGPYRPLAEVWPELTNDQ